MGHTLLCVLSLFLLNTLLYGNAQGQSRDPAEGADESDVEKGASTGPKPTLTASSTVIPEGGSITLTCSVKDSAGLRYELYRRSSNTNEYQPVEHEESRSVFSVSQGGIYICRAQKPGTNDTYESEPVTIQKTVPVTVTLQPNWSQIFSGEMIIVRCEIQGGGDTEWTYEWEKNSYNKPPSHEYRINRASVSDSGDYRCRGKSDYSITEWSDKVTLTVSPNKPRPTLRADTSIIPAGGRVTLTCSVDRSAGWTVFKWYRRSSDSSEAQVINGGRSNHIIRISEGGIYTCRGGRGKPEFFTEESNKVTIQKTVSNTVTVTLQPNWPQIFSGETITVRCEIQGGGNTEWTYEWEKNSYNKPPSRNEYRINRATESDSGDYKCRGRKDYFLTQWSNVIRLTVSSDKPQASMRADTSIIPAGGSVTLTCSVNPSPGWKYFLYRDNKLSEPLTTHDAAFQTTGRTSVSQEGLYSCRGGRGDPVYYTEYSHSVSIDITVSNRAVVILQPNVSEIYRGETITVRCEIQGGGDTEWEYKWKTPTSFKPSNQHEHRISSASSSHSGDYRCKGRVKSSQHETTEWSASVRLTVYDNKPRPVLTVSPSWLSPGASVTLNCEVEHPSAGWRFYWYKTVPDLSHNSYSYELLPGSSSGTEQDSYIVHGQTHTAGYVCRAGRGDPVFYTENSEPKFVWSGDLHPAASLTVNPDRVQHFTSDSVSLSCEGNSAEWRVKRFTDKDLLDCSEWGTITGSTCNIHRLQEGDAVYWCESQSGEFSNAVNITGQTKDIILVSPVHPVTKGDPVTLGCKLTTTELDSNVFFYHNDKLIQNDTRQELNISAVSKSDEGFYKCECSGKESRQSWVAVKSLESSFPVPVLGGLLSGIVMIILLFLLCHYKKAKGSYCDRPIQSLSTNQDFAMDQTASETQQPVYSSLLHGDVSVYESIRGSKNTTDGTTGAFPSHHLTGLDKSDELGGHDDPEESSDYYNMREELANGP